MRLFITGATGLVGRRLVLDRLARGDRIVILSRDADRASKLFAAHANPNITVLSGNPAAPGPWQKAIAGCDGVVHLAGAGIADRRWSAAYKKILHDSRIDSTHQIVNAIAQAASDSRPRVLVCASAVGYYGPTCDTPIDETAPQWGGDFLAQLTTAWEAQALAAQSAGVRVVLVRSGVILDDRGGALPKMVRPFRMMVGGPLGSGRQHMPWIHWRDLIGLINLALENSQVEGPVNAVAPQLTTNKQFARAVGGVLGKPSGLPAPKFAVRIVLGEVAKYATMNQAIVPARALEAGYRFLYPQIEPALESLLGTQASEMGEQAIVTVATTGDVRVTDSERDDVDGSGGAMPDSPIALLAISVDCCLLRSDGSIAQGVVQACRSAERAGCIVVLATARPPRGLRAILQTLGTTGPAITYNGAVIWNPPDNRADYHEPLPSDLSRRIIDEARAIQPDILVGLDVLDRWYTDRIDPRHEPRMQAHAHRLFEPDYIGPLDEHLDRPITKLNLLGSPAELEPVIDMLRERYWRAREIAMFLSDPYVIQITHPLVDKGIAMQRIAHRAGVERAAVMAIGDGVNDMGMIEWAGFGVAVANAPDQLKRLAKAVTASNDESGVAKAIQRHVLARR